MKGMTGQAEVGERCASAVVVAQLSTFFCCRNLCEEVDHVVGFDLALLLVQEAVNLAAGCGVQESGEKHKDPSPPIHSCSDTMLLFISIWQTAWT